MVERGSPLKRRLTNSALYVSLKEAEGQSIKKSGGEN